MRAQQFETSADHHIISIVARQRDIIVMMLVGKNFECCRSFAFGDEVRGEIFAG